MNNTNSQNTSTLKQTLNIKRYAQTIILVWTLLVLLLALWNSKLIFQEAQRRIYNEARVHLNKDMAFRIWASEHGGVYVPPTEHTPPNPNLAHLPYRDVETTDGKKLTLMNPAYMLRQFMDDFSTQYGIPGRIVGKDPLRAENTPDDWETAAIDGFRSEDDELAELSEIDGDVFFRLIKPLTIKQSCIPCHAQQNYRLGEIAGAVVVSVPAKPFLDPAHKEVLVRSTVLGVFWLLGVTGILLAFKRICSRVKDVIRAEEELKISEKRYRQMFENNLAIKLIIDPENGNILEANKAAHQFYGFKGTQLTKMSMLEINTLPKNEILAEMKRARKEERRFFSFQHRIASGDIRDVEVFSGPVQNGQQTDLYSIVNDVTQRKQAENDKLQLERQVLHAQKLESLGVLAGGIAHDFNNLLMAILGNADLALDGLSNMSPAKTNIVEIEKAAKRAAELAKQMLAYSGKGRFVVEPIHAGELLSEMSHLLEVTISKKAILKYNLAQKLPSFDGDATQVRQIIMNLITNAAEAVGQRSGVITLTTGAMHCDQAYLASVNDTWQTSTEDAPQNGYYVYFEVADTGCGMNRETIAKIFDPFFTTKFTGRGLGMSAVLGIVRGHGGAIKIYSELGRGTIFKVLFPVNTEKTTAQPYPSGQKSPNSVLLDRGTILLADDEETVCTVGRKMLERLGFEVLTARDGRVALTQFQQNHQNLQCVLLDLTMPHLNGEEAFREMRRIDPDVRVLLSSGYNEQDATQRFTGKGLAGFIQKPFTMAGLNSKLKEILGT